MGELILWRHIWSLLWITIGTQKIWIENRFITCNAIPVMDWQLCTHPILLLYFPENTLAVIFPMQKNPGKPMALFLASTQQQTDVRITVARQFTAFKKQSNPLHNHTPEEITDNDPRHQDGLWASKSASIIHWTVLSVTDSSYPQYPQLNLVFLYRGDNVLPSTSTVLWTKPEL